MRKWLPGFVVMSSAALSAQGVSPELKLVNAAAEALGGKAKLRVI